MKKKFLNGILILMLVVCGSSNLLADEIKTHQQYFSATPVGCEDEEEKISEHAIKDFKKMFSFAVNENWYKVSDGYIAKFVYEGIQYRAGYDAKGRWMNTVRSYDGTKLPAEIKYRVKTAYVDFDIVFVEEITLRYDMGYVIHVENDTAIKKLVITDMDSDIHVMEAYHKK